VADLAEKKTDKVSGQNFSLITRLPDDDTKEVILFGSAYSTVKSALFNLDRMEHILGMKAENNVRDLMRDPISFGEVVDEIISDPHREIEKDELLYDTKISIQKHNKFLAGIKWCQSKRSLVKMYGRLIGTQEQGVKLKESPEQMKLWRDSVLQLAREPLDYSSIEEDYLVV